MINDQNNIDDCIDKLKSNTLPVIIFGAGIVSEVLFHACKQQQIKIDGFCDNNINKTTKTLCGLKIFHTEQLKNSYKDVCFIISAADMKDVVEQLHFLGYTKWFSALPLLKKIDTYKLNLSASPDFVEYAVATCMSCHDSYLNPNKLFFRSIDIIITERCSLKCRDCSNLMQYYQAPKNCDTASLFKEIDAFCDIADEINEFRVIGGEPLMNPDYHLIIKHLIGKRQVKKIVIYTNGTILPGADKIQSFNDKKVLFIITNYGNLSAKLEQFIQLLDANKISYYSTKAKGWTDCSKIQKHLRTAEEQLKIFRCCCAKNTTTLSDGKLFRCPFSANAARLAAIPDTENDYINIVHSPADDVERLKFKQEIRNFLFNKTSLEVCNYCNGRAFDAPEIAPAIQTNVPLEYKRCNN